jgi:hypothetical protein
MAWYLVKPKDFTFTFTLYHWIKRMFQMHILSLESWRAVHPLLCTRVEQNWFLPSILLSRLRGESGMESPSDVRLYECSVLIGAVPRAASVMRRSWRITCGFTSKIVAVHSKSGSAAILKASEMAWKERQHLLVAKFHTRHRSPTSQNSLWRNASGNTQYINDFKITKLARPESCGVIHDDHIPTKLHGAESYFRSWQSLN